MSVCLRRSWVVQVGAQAGSCAGYLGSMGGTLYAALALHSYILSLVCCAAQVAFLPRACIFAFLKHPGGHRGTHSERYATVSGHLWHGRWWRCYTTWSRTSQEAQTASSLS